MAIPLYQQGQWPRRLEGATPAPHPGLLFDKFITAWGDDQASLEEDAKREFFYRILRRAEASAPRIGEGLEQAHRQREGLIGQLGGAARPFQTDWRFVSGQGSGHPLESGFLWHRTLGVPYLPGSAVKGMMRAWAGQWSDEPDAGRIERLFGPWEIAETGGDSGAFIAFDALPEGPPRLEVDILNPHYQPYYSDPSQPPADYYSPVPVFFLSVAPEQAFRFALAPRPGADCRPGDMEWLWEILGEALGSLGAGAKTAVGYGGFREIRGPEGPPPRVRGDETAVWLKEHNESELIFVDGEGNQYVRDATRGCQFKKRFLAEGKWYILRGNRAVHLPQNKKS